MKAVLPSSGGPATRKGVLWLFTLGLCGIGWLVDLIMILCGKGKDKDGLPITQW